MRKRLFIFAAATCFALSAFATPAFAEGPNLTDEQTIGSEASVQSDGNSNGNVKEDALPGGSDDALPNEESHSDEERSYSVEGQANSGAAAPVVVKIGNAEYEYETLQEAINVACNDTTSSDATITLQDTLQGGLTLDDGLRFIGSGDTAGQWKNITLDAANHSLTLNNKGIYATRCKVTIKNCPELTVKAGTNPSDTPNISAVFFCPGTLTLDKCATVNITNPEPKTDGGSGICVYNEGSLYFKNGTNVAISGYLAGTNRDDGVSGIYMDKDPGNDDIMGEIVISDTSTLTISNCHHNGITANPANITVTGNSTLDVNNNNNNGVGKGGIGCYFGNLTVTDNSHVIASKNTGKDYAIFVNDLYVDKSSDVSAIDNGILFGGCYGITIGGHGVVEGKLTASGNWGPGVSAYYDDENCSLTVKAGGQITSCDNYNYGITNASTFTVKSGATVKLQRNLVAGLDNYPAATTTVEENANFIVTDNYGAGINNGNNTDKDYNNVPFTNNASNVATLILKSGLITENHNVGLMPCPPYQLRASADYGAGICNRYGNVDISIATKIYNNHADTAGDDLYNYPLDATAAAKNTISLTIPGAVWEKLDERGGGGIIDNWYDDSETNRWNAATHAEICEDSKSSYRFTLPENKPAWKAAHGAVAPTPTPATPKPAEPTAAPTVAPTAAPTTAPADNTATAAPATPAPTARPAVTATPAPTAQASGVIPQTGDSSSPALFSILTLGSITALCVLQKRRKSK